MKDRKLFSQNQYDLLTALSKKRLISKWNATAHLGIRLCGADLSGLDLGNINFLNAALVSANLCNTNLSGAHMAYADLYNANLSGANLSGADLSGANLSSAVIHDANLYGANFSDASLSGVKFNGSSMENTNFIRAELTAAQFNKTNLYGADFSGAYLRVAQFNNALLQKANFFSATLIETHLNNANISGVGLYGTARDDWQIDGIKCEYVYWDKERRDRTPKNRYFKPDEFEQLYKSLPEITYYFSDDFTPITPFLIERVVNSINLKYPHFRLRLDSFHARGTPHAVFTIHHKEYAKDSLKAITNGYKNRIARLEGKLEAYQEAFSQALNKSKPIHIGDIDHMGNTFGNIASGRDVNIATDNASVSVVNNDIDSLIEALKQQNVLRSNLESLRAAIESDQRAPEHVEKSFGKHVKGWLDKAYGTAWRIAESTTAGTAAGLTLNALKAYYGWS